LSGDQQLVIVQSVLGIPKRALASKVFHLE
jgi:hypothetical protein